MIGNSTKQRRTQIRQWQKHRQSGTKNRDNNRQYAMTFQPEEIQPQDWRQSTAPKRGPSLDEKYKNSAKQLVKAGVAQHKKGDYEQAVKSFQAALKAQILQYGGDHPVVAHTLANIGAVFLKQGRLPLAEEALQKSLEIKEQLRTKCENEDEREKISVADVLNNLGNLAYLQGNYTQSMQYYRQNLREVRSRETPDKDLANALHNIGRLHVIRKDWDAASSILAQCQKVETELFGPKSPELADTLELIGYIHLSNCCYDNAMIAFSDALSIHQRHLGAVHENVATSLVNVGMVMEGQGNLKNACHTYSTARDVFQKLRVPEDHRGLKAANISYENLRSHLRNEKQKVGKQTGSAFDEVRVEAERDERESLGRRDYSEEFASEQRD